jgi:predicted transcriptional regulator YdeE
MSVINAVNGQIMEPSSEMISSITNTIYDNATKKRNKEEKEANELKLYLEKKKKEVSLEIKIICRK